jgi:uncharacterized membrane protein YeaQ/YmgE (transglycosylase-associated protein family)
MPAALAAGSNGAAHRPAVNLFVWIAFGAISGFTAFHLSPVDRSIGVSGQTLFALAGSMFGGLLGGVLFGINPFAVRIDMLALSMAVVGSVIAVVAREEARRRQLGRATATRRLRRA